MLGASVTHVIGSLAVTAFLVGGAPFAAPDARAQTAPTAIPAPPPPVDSTAIVDALKAIVGNPPRARATFAKGVCVRGTYTPSEQAAEVTKSRSFTQPARVLGRFSVGGGNPSAADTNKAVLRGFSVRLEGEGSRSTLLIESAPVHFARTLDQMRRFLEVRIPGPDGKQDVEKIKAFSAENPETLNQANYVAARPLPGSFAGVTYWGVHSFPVTNANGNMRFIKFKVVPLGGEVTLSEDEARTRPADFLAQDLAQRIAADAVRFNVLALLDRPGDPVLDVTIRWPDEDSRPSVRLGTIAINATEPNTSCDAGFFDPADLAEGIGLPVDEIFSGRQTAYGISLSKRID